MLYQSCLMSYKDNVTVNTPGYVVVTQKQANLLIQADVKGPLPRIPFKEGHIFSASESAAGRLPSAKSFFKDFLSCTKPFHLNLPPFPGGSTSIDCCMPTRGNLDG